MTISIFIFPIINVSDNLCIWCYDVMIYKQWGIEYCPHPKTLLAHQNATHVHICLCGLCVCVCAYNIGYNNAASLCIPKQINTYVLLNFYQPNPAI